MRPVERCQTPTRITGLITDCNTLLGLKDEFRGTQSLNWDADLPMSDWSGVILSVVDYEQRVTALVFFSWDLNGRIPARLGNLDKLEELRLTITKLAGPLPPELANLANLQVLYVSQSMLSGPIPPELSTLPNLRVLNLSRNRLIGTIPPELGSLAKLQVLSLSGNALSGSIPIAAWQSA